VLCCLRTLSIATSEYTYKDRGQLKGAEELFVPMIEMSSRLLGQEHLDMLWSISKLVDLSELRTVVEGDGGAKRAGNVDEKEGA